MRLLILSAIAIFLAGCGSVHEQYLEFNEFTIERGVYKPKPGWNFIPQEDGTIIVAKDNSNTGTKITPCECVEIDAISGGQAPPPGGSCEQAYTEDDQGNILEVWCVNYGCGYCKGGTSSGLSGVDQFVKFKLERVGKAKRK